MRIIALFTDAPLPAILAELGEPTAPPGIAPARGSPLWEAAGAELVDASVAWGASAPADEFDQRSAR